MASKKSPKTPHEQRLEELKGVVADHDFDALHVSNLTNVRYLTGFKGTFGFLVVDHRDAHFITDGRYAEIAEGVVRGAKIHVLPTNGQREFLVGLFRGLGYKYLGAEGTMTVDDWDTLKDRVRPAGTRLIREAGLVASLRRVKDESEIKIIRKAARIADQMMEAACEALRPGAKESEVDRVIRRTAEDLGATGVSFDPIVASGPNASRPHHRPSSRRLRQGDMVTLDLGAVVDGYCSDLTRNPVIGKVDARFEEIYAVCLEAQEAALKACIAGAKGAEVDGVAREIIATAGYGEYFNHGTGHGVGLEIHEAPRLSPTSSHTLLAGEIVTVEPGIYIPGYGGVRIEDLVLVTDGKPKVLSKSPKHLRVVPA